MSFYFTALGIEWVNWRSLFTKKDVILSWLTKWCLIYKCNGGTKAQILLWKKMKSPGNNVLKQIQFRKQFKSYCMQFTWVKRIVDRIQAVCVQLNLALVEGIVYQSEAHGEAYWSHCPRKSMINGTLGLTSKIRIKSEAENPKHICRLHCRI